jgi:lincosamide nucleotidyltransferase A/C/D/E
MTEESALEILVALWSHGVTASVDGGWGVDALVGRQTRPHEDLDLVVALGEVDEIKSALLPLAFSIAEDRGGRRNPAPARGCILSLPA